MAEGHRQVAVSPVREAGAVFAGVVVGVDDELADPGAGEMLEGELDQRPPEDGDQGFRELSGQGLEPGTQAGAEDESFLHGRTVARGGRMSIFCWWREGVTVGQEFRFRVEWLHEMPQAELGTYLDWRLKALPTPLDLPTFGGMRRLRDSAS